jgi:hypothetical protein
MTFKSRTDDDTSESSQSEEEHYHSFEQEEVGDVVNLADKDDDDEEDEDDTKGRAQRSSGGKTLLQQMGSKKPKLAELWTPPKADHCKKGMEYLTANPKERAIFKYMQLTKDPFKQSSSNWIMQCLCCKFHRTASISVCLQHFSLNKCTAESIPADVDGNTLQVQLTELALLRENAYKRNRSKAEDARQPDKAQTVRSDSDLRAWLINPEVRQESLVKDTAKMLIGCNLPASIVENKTFREYVCRISGNKISDVDSASLKRKAVSKAMDEYAEQLSKSSLEDWTRAAKQKGGSLLVDGFKKPAAS